MPRCEWCGRMHDVLEICRPRPGFTRRSFFGLLGAAVARVVLAPASVLTGLKFTPKYYHGPLLLDEINQIALKKIMPGVVDNFFKSEPLFQYLSENAPHRQWSG